MILLKTSSAHDSSSKCRTYHIVLSTTPFPLNIQIHDAKLTALARKKDHENDQLRANHEALDKIIGGMENQAKVFTDLSQKARQTYQSGGGILISFGGKRDVN
jgi:hypothetical protein